MTVETKIRCDDSYMEEIITRKAEEGKEFTPKEISYLAKRGIYELIRSKSFDNIIGPKLEKALKRIDLNLILSTNSPSDTLDAIIKIYQDYVKDKTSEKQYNWPSDLRRYAHKLKYARSNFNENDFFFGWLLIQTVEFKEYKRPRKRVRKLAKYEWRPVKHDWRMACDLMSRVSGISKYLKEYDSRKKRNNIYKLGIKYIKIICRAYRLKLFLEGLNKVGEILTAKFNGADRKFLKAQTYFGYDADLTKRIYSFLSDLHYKEGKSSTSIRLLYRRFSNKREEDIIPCLFFLKRMGLILLVMKNKIYRRVYFLGRGKTLKEALPFWVNYNSIFDIQEFKKEFLSSINHTV